MGFNSEWKDLMNSVNISESAARLSEFTRSGTCATLKNRGILVQTRESRNIRPSLAQYSSEHGYGTFTHLEKFVPFLLVRTYRPCCRIYRGSRFAGLLPEKEVDLLLDPVLVVGGVGVAVLGVHEAGQVGQLNTG